MSDDTAPLAGTTELTDVTESPVERQRNRSTCVPLLRWAVTCIALGLAAYLVVRDWPRLTAVWRLGAWRLGALFFLFLVQFCISTIPYLAILRRMSGSKISFLQWLRIMIVSRFANNLAPQAGTAYRAVQLKSRFGVSYTVFIHVFALFAWMTTVLNLLLASGLSLTLLRGGSGLERTLVVGLMLGTSGVAIAPFVAIPCIRLCPMPGKWAGRLRLKVQELLEAITEYATKPDILVAVVGLGLVRFCLWVVFFKIAFSGLGISLSYAHLALFLAIWQLSSLIIITPGNLGVQELVYGVVGGAVGLGAAHGVLISALIRAAQYLTIFPLGFACGGWGLVRIGQTGKPSKAAINAQ